MAKRKEKKSKRSVLSTIALALFALVLAGFVFDAVNDHLGESKDEDPIVDELPGDDEVEIIHFQFKHSEGVISGVAEKGMTWDDWLNSDYHSQITCDNESASFEVSANGETLSYRINAGFRHTDLKLTDVILAQEYTY